MFFRSLPRSVHVLFELADVHQCNKVDFHCCCFVCLFFTSFHSFSTATFASGINIAWGERSFAHTRFPKTSVSERQISRNGCTFHLCVHPSYLCVHLRLAEQNNIWSLYFFLPKSTLESISYSPGGRVTRRILLPQIRHVARRDSMRQLSPYNKWIKWRAFFRSFHRNEFAYQVVILHRIQSFPAISIQMNFASDTALVILEQRFHVCMFGNTVFCME